MTSAAIASSLVLLAACGGGRPSDNAASDTSSSATGGSTTTAASNAPAWCGTKPVKVGYSDGNGSNGWRHVTLALLKQYVSTCPNITDVVYLDARGSAQTQVEQTNSLIAQGVNVIVTMPDAGPTLLPVWRRAMAAGIKVVPFTQPPEGGVAGKDYVTAVVADNVLLGKQWGEWMCKTLKGTGNIVDLGGVPGNSQSDDELTGTKQAFAEPGCEGMKILDPAPVTTNWDVQMYQQAMTGLLAKYDKIDGIIVDFGGGFLGAVTAYQNAGKTLPAVATNSDNTLTCEMMKEGNPFVEYTSGNKEVQNALEQGVAAYEGTTAPQKALYPQTVVFDTENGPKPQCAPGLPAGAALGEGLSIDQLKQILN